MGSATQHFWTRHGICIVCFGVLVVFVFWYVVPTHTKNCAKSDRVWTTVSLRELDNIDGSMKLLHLKHFFYLQRYLYYTRVETSQ